MSRTSPSLSAPIRHYLWAGLDFMFDRDGTPVLIEANKSSHMLGEYMQFHGDERPFELIAGVMNRADGPPCLLWRRGDPLPDADEDACFIGRYLTNHLREPPIIGNVEDNQEPREEFITRDGRRIRPGSLFRWWYGLPWSYERSGVVVINPNCVWTAVRDKLTCYTALAGAKSFRIPQAFGVESADEARRILAEKSESFRDGFVLKPRVGWGGQGAQIGNSGSDPQSFTGNYLLSERIVPPPAEAPFWEVRVFVMAGAYLGGIKHVAQTPNTNYWQGGRPVRLDDHLAARLEPAALEAVRLLDAAADRIHRLPEPPATELTTVVY